ncbi:alpha-tubulin N-acetyltransferase [Biomphalaria glabrata]|nr:alpha-tubulin N-acetyltransferase [Biomphalaria glabrata]
MDFSFNVNSILPEEITEVDSSLKICRQNVSDRFGFRQLQSMLYEVIDRMGEASAKAQGLHGPITTGKKMEISNHRLYIMKDTQSNNGHGSVVGFLKMGCKKLFVYNHSKIQQEMEPLCVLDFYVHESRQRIGCGKKLFEYMLMNERIPVQHLAIDRPSTKFLSFLSRHYGLQNIIPQVNNFVIFEGFFNNRLGTKNGRPSSIISRPPSGHRSQPRISSSPHQNQYLNQTLNRNMFKEQTNGDYSWTVSGLSSRPQLQSHMGAGQQMYSRHGVSSLTNINSRPTRGYTPSREHTTSNEGNNHNLSRGFDAGSDVLQEQNAHPDQRFPKDHIPYQNDRGENSYTSRTGISNVNYNYQEANSNTSSTSIVDPRYPKDVNSHQLPNISSVAHRPPSGRQNNYISKLDPSFPHHDGSPARYQNFLNLHSTYQGRNGHLNLPPSPVPAHEPVPSASTLIAHPSNQNSSWTVMGVLRDQRMTSPLAARHNNRLW